MGRPDAEPHRARCLDIADEIVWHCNWDEGGLSMHDELGSEIMLYNVTNFFPALEIQDSEQGFFVLGVNNELNGVERPTIKRNQLCNLKIDVSISLSL